MPKLYKGPDNHTSAYMVPRFLRKRTAQATINAVRAAMPNAVEYYIIGMAAYIWYQRSNGRKTRYAGWKTNAEYLRMHAEYLHTGVYPVSAERLATIKPSTVNRYAALVQA